jgi:adenine-specific DNA methylase
MNQKTRDELIAICKEKNIKGYSGKKKNEIVEMLNKLKEIPLGEQNSLVLEVPSSINRGQSPLLVDLFAGTGAFTYAFEKTGKVKGVFSNDMVESSKQIYDLNFDHKLTLQDLNDIPVDSIPNHDILTGGFPCQPFSIAGKQEGFQDKRSNVFWKILEIIDHPFL